MDFHRLELRPSRLRQWCILALFTLLIISLWLWKPDVFMFQWVIQLIASAALMLVCYKALFQPQINEVVSYNELGRWLWMQPPDNTQWQIKSGSRFAGAFIWLQLTDVVTGKSKVELLYRDSMPDADFRHLRRTVLRQIKQASVL